MHVPDLHRTTSDTHRAILTDRLKRIDMRRALIETRLRALRVPNNLRQGEVTPQQVELETELGDLNATRRDIETILHPRPSPARSPELQRLYDQQREVDKQFLRATIKQQTEQAEAAAQKLEIAGEFRQARLQRAHIPDIPEQVCIAFGKDPALLAEIEPDNEGARHDRP